MASYDTELITVVKSFIVQAPGETVDSKSKHRKWDKCIIGVSWLLMGPVIFTAVIYGFS
jgi:hypothetical protein